MKEPQLRDRWPVLGGVDDRYYEALPVTTSDIGDVFIAVEASGARHLLVPAERADLPLFTASAGLAASLSVQKWGDAPASRMLDVVCALPTAFREFDLLVQDVEAVVAGSTTPGACALEVIKRWRLLFERGLKALDLTAQIGVFAELLVLEKVLSSGLGDVATWRGPFREPHDFELAARSLEVKAFSGGSETIEIHGLAQLERVDDKVLDLVLIEVEQRTDGLRLSDLVTRITRVFGVDLTVPLSALGWVPPLTDSSEPGLVAGAARRIRVREGVPRLVRDGMPASTASAVSRVRYSLSLAALLPWVDTIGLGSIVTDEHDVA